MKTSDTEKKKFAEESIAFNIKNKEFVDLFGADGTAGKFRGGSYRGGYYSILLLYTLYSVLVSCFMWSGALDSSNLLLSYPLISLASLMTDILISALKYTHLYAYS